MGGGKISDHLPPAQLSIVDDASSTSLESASPSSSARRQTPDSSPDDEQIARRLRYHKTYLEILRSYETPAIQAQALQEARDAITRHRPGDLVEQAGGTELGDYQVPETIALLLVGPRGSGKSSLVNRITRIFEDDPFTPDRAQVSHNLAVTNGSCFLLEYVIPRNSGSFCVYDTRSLSTLRAENFKLLEKWMTQGVRHGDMILRDSDADSTKKRIKAMARQGLYPPCQKRMVNFVIFVVDGVSVLKSMDSEDAEYNDMVVETFNYPFLSFKDNKPVVVVTHGDELSLTDRARVCTHLGELLGIPPTQQIFDIPVTNDHATELAIVRMLRYSIEHANRNLPFKQHYLQEGLKILPRMMDRLQGFDACTLILEVLIICLCIAVLLLRVHES